MYHNDHAPPHFHAKYSGKSGSFSITEGYMLEGDLPPRVVALIVEWALQHKDELIEDWKLAENGEALKSIEPLT